MLLISLTFQSPNNFVDDFVKAQLRYTGTVVAVAAVVVAVVVVAVVVSHSSC